jgi:hypothetical protein
LKSEDISSASASGSTPRVRAACAIFRPCSSVPVMKKTSRPIERWKRAMASVAIAS